jgi:hypothetical protein
MHGVAIDTCGIFNERDGMLGWKSPSRREGGDVMAAGAKVTKEGVRLEEAVERIGSSKLIGAGDRVSSHERPNHETCISSKREYVYMCTRW